MLQCVLRQFRQVFNAVENALQQVEKRAGSVVHKQGAERHAEQPGM